MRRLSRITVSPRFARDYRSFCTARCLNLERFAERVLREVMEDCYFGEKALRVLKRARRDGSQFGCPRRPSEAS